MANQEKKTNIFLDAAKCANLLKVKKTKIVYLKHDYRVSTTCLKGRVSNQLSIYLIAYW